MKFSTVYIHCSHRVTIFQVDYDSSDRFDYVDVVFPMIGQRCVLTKDALVRLINDGGIRMNFDVQHIEVHPSC